MEFEPVERGGFLGSVSIPAGNTTRYRLRCEGVLLKGEILTGATGTSTSSVSLIDDVALSDDAKSVFFYVEANTQFEIFTVALNLTTNEGETWNYTAIFQVEAPITQTFLPNPRPLIIGPTGPAGPSTEFIPPKIDPGVTGAVWNNSGTLAISNG